MHEIYNTLSFPALINICINYSGKVQYAQNSPHLSTGDGGIPNMCCVPRLAGINIWANSEKPRRIFPEMRKNSKEMTVSFLKKEKVISRYQYCGCDRFLRCLISEMQQYAKVSPWSIGEVRYLNDRTSEPSYSTASWLYKTTLNSPHRFRPDSSRTVSNATRIYFKSVRVRIVPSVGNWFIYVKFITYHYDMISRGGQSRSTNS